ncbi:copper resistance protein CopC [Streptosporangium lutulentum]
MTRQQARPPGQGARRRAEGHRRGPGDAARRGYAIAWRVVSSDGHPIEERSPSP